MARPSDRFIGRVPGGGDAGIRGRGLIFAVAESNMANRRGPIALRNRTGDNSGQRGGSFSQFQQDFVRRSEILAEELAQLAVDELRRSLKRKGASQGTLERALLDRRNRWVRSTGFGFGDISFLDRSDAKYWRTIEQGTRQFVGTLMTGVWYEGGQPYGFLRSRKQDTFRPMRASDARRVLAEADYRGPRGGRGKVSAIIRNPIHPHQYLQKAWRRFKPRERSREALLQALIESGVVRR